MRHNIGKLTLLRCSNCGSDLKGLSTDVIFYCSECGRCWISGEHFEPVDIEFVRIGDSDSVFLPFWRVDAEVTILSRHSRKRFITTGINGSREFTGRERGLSESDSGIHRDRFIFPAFSTGMVLSTGIKMHLENFLPDKMEHGKRFTVIGGSVGKDDAVFMTKGVAVGVEVSRTDYLASVDLDIEVHAAGIYAIGCKPEESVFKINGSEIRIPYAVINDSDEILEKS